MKWGGGSAEEVAVSSCKKFSWLCQCGSHPLSHYRFHIRAAACPRAFCESKLLPRGRKMKREPSVLYLFKNGRRQTALALLWLKCTGRGWI